MTALRKIGAVLLLSSAAGGVVAADEFEAQSQRALPIAHTVLYHSESVLGKNLIASGENAGRIVDVLTDESGRVRAVVVDYGGFLGVGSRKIAVAGPTCVSTGMAATGWLRRICLQSVFARRPKLRPENP